MDKTILVKSHVQNACWNFCLALIFGLRIYARRKQKSYRNSTEQDKALQMSVNSGIKNRFRTRPSLFFLEL